MASTIRTAACLVIGAILIIASLILIFTGAYELIIALGTLNAGEYIVEDILKVVIGFIILIIGIWVLKKGGIITDL